MSHSHREWYNERAITASIEVRRLCFSRDYFFLFQYSQSFRASALPPSLGHYHPLSVTTTLSRCWALLSNPWLTIARNSDDVILISKVPPGHLLRLSLHQRWICLHLSSSQCGHPREPSSLAASQVVVVGNVVIARMLVTVLVQVVLSNCGLLQKKSRHASETN